jgi:hypothetical protein
LPIPERTLPLVQLLADEAKPAFDVWMEKADRQRY